LIEIDVEVLALEHLELEFVVLDLVATEVLGMRHERRNQRRQHEGEDGPRPGMQPHRLASTPLRPCGFPSARQATRASIETRPRYEQPPSADGELRRRRYHRTTCGCHTTLPTRAEGTALVRVPCRPRGGSRTKKNRTPRLHHDSLAGVNARQAVA
jgi:hypothetical protein